MGAFTLVATGMHLQYMRGERNNKASVHARICRPIAGAHTHSSTDAQCKHIQIA